MKQTLLVFLGAVLLLVSQVSCWGSDGHAIVATVAQSLLTAQALKGIQQYLNGQAMNQVSSVADDYDHTAPGKWSEALHFVNMNRGETQYDAGTDCEESPGCVVSAVLNYTQILKQHIAAGKTLSSDEPNALVFLIHFVGDAHQPLHVGWADDLGGNHIKCTFFGDKTELHAVWDSMIIDRYNNDYSSFAQELTSNIQSNSTIIPLYTKSMNPVDWADESFSYVRNVVYTGVSGSNPQLGGAYYQMSLPVVKERLTAAGVRLGYLVNSLFQ